MEPQITNGLAEYAVVFIAGFSLGILVGNLLNRSFREWSYKHKLYGIDGNDGIRTFLIIVVTIIWFVANIMAFRNGKPVDLATQALMGTIIGSYFGTLLKNKNAKK